MKDLIAGSIATCLGAIALLVAAGFGAERAAFFADAKTTKGTVVALVKNPWSNTTRAGKYPVVEFTARKGKTIRIEGSSSYPPRYRVGQRVRVYYDRSDPADGRLDDFFDLWLAIIISGSLAVVMLPMGGLILGLRWRRKRLEKLRTDGAQVVGTVTHADTSNVQEWGKTVQRLTVEATDPISGQLRRYQSLRTPGEGDQWIGQQLTVYVDRDKPDRYLVDIPAP